MLSFDIDRKKLETLIEINTLINSNYADARVLLTHIIQSATLLTNAAASSLLLVNPENNRLYFEIALGSKGQEVKRFPVNMGQGIAGWVAQNNKSVIVNDVAADERFYADISRQIGYPTNSILAVPMRVRDRCVGVIEILNKTDGRPFTEEDLQWLEIFATQAAIAVQNARIYERAQQEIHVLQDQVKSDQGYHTFVGSSRPITERLAIAHRAAQTDSSVLLLGESGVGKELFAEQIHLQSRRAQAPFIRVNCAALPENLLESELFGHVKGAFTGASADRRGRFELAHGGTIFLDEVGDIPLLLQAKLLRVIQHRTFERVGSSEPQQADVRIIAATNKDIEREVSDGRFRTDLYYRLNVLPILIPPLRERREDIPELAEFFLRRVNAETKKTIRGFTDEAMGMLLSYGWPGNVRELENAVERAVVITDDDTIDTQALSLNAPPRGPESAAYDGQSLRGAITIFKRHFIRNALERNGWNQTRTSKALSIQRTYLSRLLKELNIAR
jgi:Nif-specific regulatory protein